MTTLAVDVDEQRLFEEKLERAREEEARKPRETILRDGTVVAWSPLPGSQTAFLSCPLFEVLYHGQRGGGKTLALLFDFAQDVGKFGKSWRGALFRRTYPELADVVAKTEQWFPLIFPDAEFNRARMQWEWPGGEVLMFRHLKVPEQYWSYHGHEIPWIAFEELTNWASDECFRMMQACVRSSDARVPRKVRATTNSYGIGHSWIKERYRLAGQWWRTVVVDDAKDAQGRPEPKRCAIFGRLEENRVLMEADPDYRSRMGAAARSAEMRKAWLLGSWDIVAGGMFSDVWDPATNLVPPFAVPSTWKIDRAFDWGSARPFSVLWFARSDGSDLALPNGRVRSTVRGDLFVVREWYGWTGKPNEGLRMLAGDVAAGIVERELAWGWREVGGRSRVSSGVADSMIFSTESGASIAVQMNRPVRVGGMMHDGIHWLAADKRPGSRKQGWEIMRGALRAARPAQPGMPRELPGLFVVGEHCPQLVRTMLAVPRDEKDPDDVDTDAEDHACDAARYRMLAASREIRSGRVVGAR